MKAVTQLYESEGRANLNATLRSVARAANTFDVGTIVVFAASADAVVKLRDLVDESRDVVAVTFPAGLTALVDNEPAFIGMPSADDRRRLAEAGIPLVQGIMPLRALGDGDSEQLRTLRRTLDFFGGGLQLCVQAILMGCDAGVVPAAARCIAMSADTAIVARAEHGFRFLGKDSRFAIEHVVCKPTNYSITRPSSVLPAAAKQSAESDSPTTSLPASMPE